MNAVAPAMTAGFAWRTQLVACNLCGSQQFSELYPSRLPEVEAHDIQKIFACTSSAYGECGPIVRCNGCGLIYQNPQPDPTCLLEAYEEVEDTRYEDEREGRLHTFRRALQELEAHVAAGRLLDIGAHIGVAVEVARERGWDAMGVEPSRWATAVGNARGLPIVNGTIENLPQTLPLFDAVTIWDVIEHLPDPLGELRRIRPLMRPDGVIAISTMDVQAPVARLLGRNWPWYMQMHLYYFSQQTLSQLVEKAGYEVIEIRRHRRIVRLAYLMSRIERRAAWLYPMMDRALRTLRLSDRLVAIDLGDIVTLFARARGPLLAGGTNGHSTRSP